VLFYYFALSSLLVLPLALLDWRVPTSASTWLVLLAIGVAQLLSQLFIVFGYYYASAVRLSPIVYSVIVFSAIIDWVFWGHAPTVAVVAGMALVIGGGLLAILMRPRTTTAAAPPTPEGPQTERHASRRAGARRLPRR
jgi:drug/metabolite transporter (DMT)-like permease